jgi:alkanesulfonate monooxygenase SsuD/methylene tetrahydromethanopterin reductase-like flavin-dependent oxidoreductase (luciferase family)
MDQAAPQLTELGFYTLAGHSATPRDLIREVRDAERIGLGAAFVSERFNTKDAATLCGAVAATSETLGIATAATNHNTRHPIVTATFAMTMHTMTGGRFSLGLGRGFDMLFGIMGLPPITMAQMTDAIDLQRRLWHGELIMGHDGPAGAYPMLCLDPSFDADIPVTVTAIGERTLEWAGGVADSVVLHTFFTDGPWPAASPQYVVAPSAQVAIRRRSGSGRCSPPSATTSTRSSGSRSWSVGSPRTCRATAT